MALANINKFNWDKLLSKIESADMKRRVNLLRGKANEISANSAKYLKEPEAIDFAGYSKKLKFTGSAVKSLEAAYKSKTLPTYHATLPAFEAKKRAMMAAVAKNVVDLAKQDINDMSAQLEAFESIRIGKHTSVNELNQRFPNLAKEIEHEIKHHEWNK